MSLLLRKHFISGTVRLICDDSVLGVPIENSSDLTVCFTTESFSMALTSKKIEEFNLIP